MAAWDGVTSLLWNKGLFHSVQMLQKINIITIYHMMETLKGHENDNARDWKRSSAKHFITN